VHFWKCETIEGPEYRFIGSVRQRYDIEVIEFFGQIAMPHGTILFLVAIDSFNDNTVQRSKSFGEIV
jgi:hypothetical protein